MAPLAWALRQAGDPRILDQQRAGLATRGLLAHRYGPCPTHPHTDNAAAGDAPASGDPGETGASFATPLTLMLTPLTSLTTPTGSMPTALWNLGPLDRRRHHKPKPAQRHTPDVSTGGLARVRLASIDLKGE